jgi:hypothetical protein
MVIGQELQLRTPIVYILNFIKKKTALVFGGGIVQSVFQFLIWATKWRLVSGSCFIALPLHQGFI